MKFFLSTFLFLVAVVSYSQNSTTLIQDNIHKFEQALIQKDTVILKTLLHDNLTLGHSNGWIETKKSIVNDLSNGKVSYTAFRPTSDVAFTYMSDSTIITRRSVMANGIVDNIAFSVHLNILEIWIKQHDSWLLLARQSVGIKKD